MSLKEKLEFLALLQKLSKKKQQVFCYMTEGAKIIAQRQ